MRLHHELMISRFHYTLEKAFGSSNGAIKLVGFYQGSMLWHEVEVPKIRQQENGSFIETDEIETLPHRPDAFFALHFPTRSGEEKTQFYFYEADRKTTSIKKMQKKLRAHFHYIVKQKRHVEEYGVNSIRAVLVESLFNQWTENLLTSARHSIVSGGKLSTLFWFTPSEQAFEKLTTARVKSAEKMVPLYLEKPELVLMKIWATPLAT